MQSINAGFQSLKTLLPHTDGEKLSKVLPIPPALTETRVVKSRRILLGVSETVVDLFQALKELVSNLSFWFLPCQAAILQQTADYIFTLEQEKTQLLTQNNQLKRLIQVNKCRNILHFLCKIGYCYI